MKYSALLIGALALTLSAMIPQPSLAHSERDHIVQRSSDRVALLKERVEDRRAEIEDRRNAIYDRVCERLEALQDRIGFRFSLPSFCDGAEEPESEDPPTVDLDADPMTIEEGEESTLSWDSTSADECTASGSGEFDGNMPTDGSINVSPATTTTYSIECENEDGTDSDSVMVTVEDEDDPEPLPFVNLGAASTSIESGATTTLIWSAQNANTCEASGSDEFDGSVATSGSQVVAPTSTTLYELECIGLGGSGDDSVTVFVETPAEPVADHLLISEVLADTSSEQGSDSPNEWVEIYNGTGETVDLEGWMLGDSTTSPEVITTTTVELPHDSYLIVTNSTTTENFWTFPDGTLVIFLGASLGLNNSGGDAVFLLDESAEVVDAVSYGDDTRAFDPGTDIAGNGNSLARDDLSEDTDTADDWIVLEDPTPGE